MSLNTFDDSAIYDILSTSSTQYSGACLISVYGTTKVECIGEVVSLRGLAPLASVTSPNPTTRL
jgi:hypothetical protein